jgi:hypothetical protein
MPLLNFKDLLNESGDLKLLHTSANISAPEIHKLDNGDHVAVHKTTTPEHADWLKGKFEKALKHNPSARHIKLAVKHNGDEGSELTITHHHPKNVKEDVDQPLFESEKRFNKGDHVHLRASYNFASAKKHGVVHSATDRIAHVKWEDGSESKHLHTTGKQVGQKPYDDDHIMHNEVSDPSKAIGATKRLTNDEHKEYLKKVADEQREKAQHASHHRNAIEKLSSMHHSEFKPHHLKAIHEIIDRAKAGHD